MKNKIVYKDVEKIENYRELLEKTVEKYPNNIAYTYKKDITSKTPEYIQKTYTEFREDIENLGTALLQLGLENKKIILISNNRYEWCTSYLSITLGNMIVVPLDKALQEKEIENLIIRSGAEAVIYEEKYKEIFNNIRKNKTSKLKYYINMDLEKENSEEKSYKELQKIGEKEIQQGNTEFENKKIDNEKMSIMLFTSGTTSEPKAVMLSQKNICSDIMALAQYLKLYPTDTLLSFLPLHHTFESTITFLFGIYYGVTVAFSDGLRYIAQNLVEYKISVFVAVPLVLESVYKKLQKGIEESGKKELIEKMTKISNTLLKCKIDIRRKIFKSVLDKLGGNLRIALFGAAPMDKDTIIGYNNLGIETIQGYGLTETSPVISAETDKRKRPGSIGFPLPDLEVKIENPNEQGIGEITVKGPSVMIGYYENEEETKKVLQNGWFSTGDLGYLDKDGFLYITGRKKDVIVLKNGENIYPQELEILINKIPCVLESIVYAKDEEGRKITAKVVYDEQLMKEKHGEKEEKEYYNIIWNEVKKINETLPLFKHIKEIQITTKPLAKTTTQKIKRFEEIK